MEKNGIRILVHACCAPCSSTAIERLAGEYSELAVFFYNPNIRPLAEYERRLNELERFLREFSPANGAKLIEGRRDFDAWGLPNCDDEGGVRCRECYRYRLFETAQQAKALGFGCFCTTLTLSPHKNADVINEIGESVASEVGVAYLPTNFKKRDGYLRSLQISRDFGLYRQDYCGCMPR